MAIKPNLVWESGWSETRLGIATTHPSMLRAVVDYSFKACGPSGRILICEGTAVASQWSQLVRIARLGELVRHLRFELGVPVELVNLNDTPREQALLVQLRAFRAPPWPIGPVRSPQPARLAHPQPGTGSYHRPSATPGRCADQPG